MRTLTVKVATEVEAFAELRASARRIDAGEGYQGETWSFATLPLLFEVFTPKRWELIGKLQEIGPSSLRGLAKALGRDVKRVHEDAARLLEEGVIERDTHNKLFVPFDNIRIEADLKTSSAA